MPEKKTLFYDGNFTAAINTGFERTQGPESLLCMVWTRGTKTTNKTVVAFKGLCLTFNYQLKDELLEWLQPASCSVGISHTHLAKRGNSKFVLGAFCPSRESSWQVKTIIHSHQLFRCHSLAALLLQKVIWTFFFTCSHRGFLQLHCGQKVGVEKDRPVTSKSRSSMGALQLIYTDGLKAGLNQSLCFVLTLLHTIIRCDHGVQWRKAFTQ